MSRRLVLALLALAFAARIAVLGASYAAPRALAVRNYDGLLAGCADVARYLHRRPQCAILADDERAYDALGRSIAAGRGYRLEVPWLQAVPGAPTAYGNFLYPAFVGAVYSLTGDSALVLLLVQVVLGSLAVLGVAWAAARLRGPVAGTVAGVLAALHPGLALNSAWVMSEALEAPLLVAGYLAWLRLYERRTLGSACLFGAVAGAAMLTRSPALVALPVMAALTLGRGDWRDGVLGRRLLAAATTLLICLAPWTVRNARQFHAFVPTDTKQGINLWLFNRPSEHPLREAWRGTPEPSPVPGPVAGLNEAEADRHFRRLALDYMRTKPVTVAAVSALRLGLVLVPVPRYWGRWPLVRLAVAILYVALTWAGLYALWQLRREAPGRALLGLTVAWLALMSLTAPGLRHRLSIEWAFVIGAGILISPLVQRWAAAHTSRS